MLAGSRAGVRGEASLRVRVSGVTLGMVVCWEGESEGDWAPK